MTARTFLPSGLLPPRRLGGTNRHETARPARVMLGPVGSCPHDPTLTIVVFDNSGSVSGVFGNDSIARRFDEARLAIEAVSRRCSCDQERIGILHFDTPTSLDVPPTRLSRNGWRRIARGLAVPPDGAGSSILRPSLQVACRLAEQHPDHNAVLAVASDFELFDPDLAGLYAEFGAFPGSIHAVVLRATPPRVLVDDDRITVTHIKHDDEVGAVAEAMLAALTTHRVIAERRRR